MAASVPREERSVVSGRLDWLADGLQLQAGCRSRLQRDEKNGRFPATGCAATAHQQALARRSAAPGQGQAGQRPAAPAQPPALFRPGAAARRAKAAITWRVTLWPGSTTAQMGSGSGPGARGIYYQPPAASISLSMGAYDLPEPPVTDSNPPP